MPLNPGGGQKLFLNLVLSCFEQCVGLAELRLNTLLLGLSVTVATEEMVAISIVHLTRDDDADRRRPPVRRRIRIGSQSVPMADHIAVGNEGDDMALVTGSV